MYVNTHRMVCLTSYKYKHNGMKMNVIIQVCINTHIIVSILLYQYPYKSMYPCVIKVILYDLLINHLYVLL